MTLIVIAVLVANCAFVVFGYESSPIWWTTSLVTRVCAWTCGLPSVDPNVGFITQPQGHLAALSILHGHVPWWNYFEGMGQPLAGEMQAAALFPLVILFLMPAGLLLFHLSLQIIAGVTTYLVLRRLGVMSSIATMGAILFALNGTFAWIGNAVINPIAFLPMMVLGVEIVIDRTRDSRRAGWTVLALAIALSIYAGFPETAYLDGLLAAGWALTRLFSLPRSRRGPAARDLFVGGIVGVLLSLPILVAFLDFVKSANIGGHVALGLGGGATTYSRLKLLIDPYLGGAIVGGPGATPRNLLGYFTASVTVFAIVGVAGARLRPLRWFLAGWTLLGIAGATDLLKIRILIDLVPGMGTVAFARYIWPTAEFAVIVLAALGLGDVATRVAHRSLPRWALGGVGALLLVVVLVATSVAGPSTGSDRVVVIILSLLPFLGIAVLGVTLTWFDARVVCRVAMAVMLAESFAFFSVPTFRNPTSITVASGSISYLEQNLGLNRFLSMGALSPNWGAQYSIDEIDEVDLPIPSAFTDYIHTSLAPSVSSPHKFTLPFNLASEDEVAAHLANYEALGVAYLLTPPKPLDPALSAKGLTLVAKDSHSDLYRLPHPSNFYATALATCVISHATLDHVNVNCPSATTLTRLELSMNGWTARVNGSDTPIASSNGVTQRVGLPAGNSYVSFEYQPPHENVAVLGAALGFVAMVATWVPRRGRRARRRGDSQEDETPPLRPDDEVEAASPGTSTHSLASEAPLT